MAINFGRGGLTPPVRPAFSGANNTVSQLRGNASQAGANNPNLRREFQSQGRAVPLPGRGGAVRGSAAFDAAAIHQALSEAMGANSGGGPLQMPQGEYSRGASTKPYGETKDYYPPWYTGGGGNKAVMPQFTTQPVVTTKPVEPAGQQIMGPPPSTGGVPYTVPTFNRMPADISFRRGPFG